MKAFIRKPICVLLVFALFISTLSFQPTRVQAATKYVKSFTKTYTLKADVDYMLPITVKKSCDIKIVVTIVDQDKSLWGVMVGQSNGEDYYSSDPEYLTSDNTKATIKGKLKTKGDNYLYLLSSGGDCKVKIKFTTKSKAFKVRKLEAPSEGDEDVG